MKLLVNRCYGGFSINSKVAEKYGRSVYDYDARYDERIIEAFERGEEVSGNFANLVLVDLPEECTDYSIYDYDGYEKVIYVVDGKLHWL